jgi:hypothetical protein
MAETTRNKNERGALWIKTSGRGDYMTGTIDGQPCVVFKNDRKQPGDKTPDWRVMTPTPKTPAGGRPEDEEPPF